MARRTIEWNKLTDMMPPPMVQDIITMTDEQKIVYLLSGLGGQYVTEWHHIYVQLALLIAKIYELHLRQ